MKTDTLILLSGGLDSVVLAYDLIINQKANARALFFDLNREATKPELASARRACHDLGIGLEVCCLDRLDSSFLGLIDRKYLVRDECDTGEGNTETMEKHNKSRMGFPFLLTLAAYYACAMEATSIAVAVIDEQRKWNPQLESLFPALSACLNNYVPRLPDLTFVTPYIKLSKSQVIAKGSSIKVPFELTWSCFHGADVHDGICNACVSRREAFSRANEPDPTVYARQ